VAEIVKNVQRMGLSPIQHSSQPEIEGKHKWSRAKANPANAMRSP
jgi:hypothetical protein